MPPVAQLARVDGEVLANSTRLHRRGAPVPVARVVDDDAPGLALLVLGVALGLIGDGLAEGRGG